MPYRIVEVVQTPNPDALKFVLDASPAPDRPRSVRSRAEAADPLAGALMAIEGVSHVLIHDGWITVSRTPGTPWDALRRRVAEALAAAPGPA
ncbi:MAG: NifU N-terminal domain-containing protein [Planctomycetota bacterium]|nr:NifU N-terminal domain-containing protein [Planctomycetota bacterium]